MVFVAVLASDMVRQLTRLLASTENRQAMYSLTETSNTSAHAVRVRCEQDI